MKTINDDTEDFFTNGGWSFLDPESDVSDVTHELFRNAFRLLEILWTTTRPKLIHCLTPHKQKEGGDDEDSEGSAEYEPTDGSDDIGEESGTGDSDEDYTSIDENESESGGRRADTVSSKACPTCCYVCTVQCCTCKCCFVMEVE